ncbi:hypothetical protein C8Q80DRAFT_1185806 [Daedaleopsis nitida]|nr:hypothetical protein C8Q80DRAFT_1185806 [Daedaleopsis nitida]
MNTTYYYVCNTCLHCLSSQCRFTLLISSRECAYVHAHVRAWSAYTRCSKKRNVSYIGIPQHNIPRSSSSLHVTTGSAARQV